MISLTVTGTHSYYNRKVGMGIMPQHFISSAACMLNSIQLVQEKIF